MVQTSTSILEDGIIRRPPILSNCEPGTRKTAQQSRLMEGLGLQDALLGWLGPMHATAVLESEPMTYRTQIENHTTRRNSSRAFSIQIISCKRRNVNTNSFLRVQPQHYIKHISCKNKCLCFCLFLYGSPQTYAC